jgi:hypothetical protein
VVALVDPRPDPAFGTRDLARIERGPWADGRAQGEDLTEALLAAGHGRPYDGKKKREGWCAASGSEPPDSGTAEGAAEAGE